jgi:hypothetical protein
MADAVTSDWPWTDQRPQEENPGVRLIFTGLVIFTYKTANDGESEARAVFHRATTKHHLRILVLEDCRPVFAIGGRMEPIQIRRMELGIVGKDESAAFFKGDHFRREDLEGDIKDFRWLLDLEGPDFHNAKFQRTEHKFSTKLEVKQGTFYTYKLTGHYFKCVGGKYDGKEVGYVPKVIAADISLGEADRVFFRIDGRDVLPYPLSNRADYQIYFFNECEIGCEPHSDFDRTFDAVNTTPNERFTLTPIGGEDNGPAQGLCIRVPLEASELTDEAPCMGGGFGGGGGFP